MNKELIHQIEYNGITPFALKVRQVRLRLGIKLKCMADFLGVSQQNVSAIETGKKQLTYKHLALTLEYFKHMATTQELYEIKKYGLASMKSINLDGLSLNSKLLVADFILQLQEAEQK